MEWCCHSPQSDYISVDLISSRPHGCSSFMVKRHVFIALLPSKVFMAYPQQCKGSNCCKILQLYPVAEGEHHICTLPKTLFSHTQLYRSLPYYIGDCLHWSPNTGLWQNNKCSLLHYIDQWITLTYNEDKWGWVEVSIYMIVLELHTT